MAAAWATEGLRDLVEKMQFAVVKSLVWVETGLAWPLDVTTILLQSFKPSAGAGGKARFGGGGGGGVLVDNTGPPWPNIRTGEGYGGGGYFSGLPGSWTELFPHALKSNALKVKSC